MHLEAGASEVEGGTAPSLPSSRRVWEKAVCVEMEAGKLLSLSLFSFFVIVAVGEERQLLFSLLCLVGCVGLDGVSWGV